MTGLAIALAVVVYKSKIRQKPVKIIASQAPISETEGSSGQDITRITKYR